MSAPNQRRRNWFLRHKFLTAVAALLLVGVVLDGTDGSGSRTDSEPAKAATSTPRSRPTVEPSPQAAAEEPSATPKPTPSRRPVRPFVVTRVVDGDTLELGNGEHVRVVGIDTPEEGQCGYEAATAHMERLVLGERVRLTISDEDRDGYGRLLRYVDVAGRDAGLAQIRAGFAIARYDSRDGYGYHSREDRYIAADKATPDERCPKAVPLVQQPASTPGAGCEPGYTPCVPLYPPDIDCGDVNGPIQVSGSDPHGLDRDGDGVACES